MSSDQKEKRRFARIPSHHAVLVKRVSEGGSESLAKTEVVGGGGCMFVHEEPIAVGTTIEILISVRGTVVKARGRVVYQNERPDGKAEVGVEFVDISESDRRIINALVEVES